jgi:hypothetical protein
MNVGCWGYFIKAQPIARLTLDGERRRVLTKSDGDDPRCNSCALGRDNLRQSKHVVHCQRRTQNRSFEPTKTSRGEVDSAWDCHSRSCIGGGRGRARSHEWNSTVERTQKAVQITGKERSREVERAKIAPKNGHESP